MLKALSEIKAFILLSTFILPSIFCLAQEEEFMVVVKSGIFIRDSTTARSISRCSVKFGEMVQILNQPWVKDTVNGMKGNWVKIKYNRCAGYVFDAHLGNLKKQDKNFPKNYPQYFSLQSPCGQEQYFNSDFYWYGIFDQGDKFGVSLVNVDFSVKSENWEEKMDAQYLKVSVNRTQQPFFLIGLPDSLPDYTIPKNDYMAGQSRDIYPGQHFNVGNTSAQQSDGSYYLSASGNVADEEQRQSATYFVPSFMSIKDYKIKLIHFKDGIAKAKNILEDVEQPVIYESLPRIAFVGDLNFDSVPDILFSNRTGHASANTYLFMSGYSDKEILTKVVLNRWGSCY